MKGKTALVLLAASLSVGVLAQTDIAKIHSGEKPRMYTGDKMMPGVKVDLNDPIPALHQTSNFKDGHGDFNLICLAYIADFPDYDYRWEIWDSNRKMTDVFVAQPKKGMKWAYATFQLRKSGRYSVVLLDVHDETKPLATAAVTVGNPAQVAGAAVSAPTGMAGDPNVTLTICDSVDDNWNAVKPGATWPVNTQFNVLIVDKKPFNLDFFGIDIFRQGPDGKDTNFINEYQQQISPPTSKKYATVSGLTSLQEGKYSVYIIDWRKRELEQHNGNFKEYLAKVTLTVK